MKKTLHFPQSLEELYNHPDFLPFPSTSDEWINDPERMTRCYDAAEFGEEGSFHAEIIQDWREFLSCLERDERHRIEFLDLEEPDIDALLESFETTVEAITAEIDKCEAWHEANGSLWKAVG